MNFNITLDFIANLEVELAYLEYLEARKKLQAAIDSERLAAHENKEEAASGN